VYFKGSYSVELIKAHHALGSWHSFFFFFPILWFRKFCKKIQFFRNFFSDLTLEKQFYFS